MVVVVVVVAVHVVPTAIVAVATEALIVVMTQFNELKLFLNFYYFLTEKKIVPKEILL